MHESENIEPAKTNRELAINMLHIQMVAHFEDGSDEQALGFLRLIEKYEGMTDLEFVQYSEHQW